MTVELTWTVEVCVLVGVMEAEDAAAEDEEALAEEMTEEAWVDKEETADETAELAELAALEAAGLAVVDAAAVEVVREAETGPTGLTATFVVVVDAATVAVVEATAALEVARTEE